MAVRPQRADGTRPLTRSQRHERREGDRGFSADASSGRKQVLTGGLRAIWGPAAVGPTCAAAVTGAAAAAHVGPTFLLLRLRFSSAVANVCGPAFGANANLSVDMLPLFVDSDVVKSHFLAHQCSLSAPAAPPLDGSKSTTWTQPVLNT